MKAENLKNYVGKNVKVGFMDEWHEIIPTSEGLTYEPRKGIRTIEGNVFFHNNKEMIVQEDGTTIEFSKNVEITLEVLN